jgi:metal-dependent amidase/aminoacylase/carboxypeptidase family protein
VSQKWRATILASLERVVKGECLAGNCPKDALIEPTTSYPLTENDPDATQVINEAFSNYFGEKHDPAYKDILGSEDFGILGSAVNRPYCFWFFGGHDPDTIDEMIRKDEAHKIPTNHSAYFAPKLQPTLKTGLDAMVVAALAYLGR